MVWLGPILPFINDTEENLRGIMDYCTRAKVQAVLCFGFGVTLRAGDRDYFFGQLDRHFPGMKERYIRAYGRDYVCNSPNHPRLMALFTDQCRRQGLLWQPDQIFDYLRQFPQQDDQLSLF